MPARGSKNVISETVVSFSADIDNAGIQKLFGLLDTNRLKAYTLAASLAAVTTGVYKFVQSITKEAFELDQLAKKKGKSIEQTRAENEALKAMGMTLDQIKKDKALKSMYDDLVKFNKEMEMPNMKDALANVNKLRSEFFKLKSALSYAMQAIGVQVLTNLEAPMERIGKKFKSAADWLRSNLTSVASKIGTYITAFTKGVIGIGEAVGKIVGWVNNLPDGIKAIGLAIGAVLVLLKSGPLGQILAVVSLIGDIIHDYEVYQWNKNQLENPEFWAANNENGWTDNPKDKDIVKDENGNPVAYQAPVALTSVWDVVFGEGSVEDKAYNVAKTIFEGVNKALKELITTLDTSFVEDWLAEPTGVLQQILSGINTYFTSAEGSQQISDLLINGLNAALSVADFVGRLGSEVVGSLGKLLGSALGSGDFAKGISDAFNEDNTIASGLLTGVVTAILTNGNLGASIGTGLATVFAGARRKAKEQGKKENDPDFWQSVLGIATDDFSGFAQGIISALAGAISAIDNIGSVLFTAIGNAIKKGFADGSDTSILTPISEAFELLGQEDSIFGKALSEGIFAGLLSGNGFAGLMTALTRIVAEAIANPGQFAVEIDSLASTIGDFFSIIWDAVWEGKADEKTGEKQGGFLKKLVLGEDGESGIVGAIRGAFESVKKYLGDVINGTGEWQNLGNGLRKKNGGLLGWLFGEDVYDYTGEKVDRIKGVFEKIWDSISSLWDSKSGEVTGFLDNLWTTIEPTINSWVEAIRGMLQGMLTDILNNNPFLQILFGNPNTTNISESENGGINLISTNGEKIGFDKGELSQDAQAVLKYFGQYYTLDKDKNVVMTHGGEQIGTIGSYGVLGAQNDLSLQSILQYIVKNGKLPGEGNQDAQTLWDSTYGNGYKFGVNFDSFSDVLEAMHFGRGNGKPVLDVLPKVDTTTIQSQIDSGTYHVNAVVETKKEEAWGGRIGSRMDGVTVGEDGTEYIIPITKPDRAISLIQQMFGEMGTSAVNRVMEGFGLGVGGTIGSSPASMASALQGMTMANTYNISAPVSINVNSNGADAKEIGTQIYDVAERHLIKTLRGVYG